MRYIRTPIIIIIKTLKARKRINNKLNSHMTPNLGIEPGTIVVRGELSHCYATHASHTLSCKKNSGSLVGKNVPSTCVASPLPNKLQRQLHHVSAP
jgi:hypothetical protein